MSVTGPMLRSAQALLAVGALLVVHAARADGQEPRGPRPRSVEAEVGVHGGMPFLRALDDGVRVYPSAELSLDATWSPSPSDLPDRLGAEDARLSIRRAKLGLSAELIGLFALEGSFELGGGRAGQTRYVGDGTRRWVPSDAHDGEIRAADVTVSFTPATWLSLTVGQQPVPFSMANRTPDMATPFFERPMPIVGFAVPYRRALGATAWGEVGDRVFGYEVGIFSGAADGPTFSGNADLWARVFTRPLAALGEGVFFELAELGVSGHVGTRDATHVEADHPSIATGQGFVLWQPGYVDGVGDLTRVLPADTQRALGGELRLPFRTPTHAVFDLVAEAYYVGHDTREVDAATPGSSARLGRLEGVGWYASLTWWACFIPGFDQLVTGEPGITRPRSIDDARAPALESGLDASILAGGIHAKYEGDARGGSAAGAPATTLDVYELGGVVQYRLGANVRAGISYMAYVAPDSGAAERMPVVVPDDLARRNGAVGDGHVAHELGMRLSAAF